MNKVCAVWRMDVEEAINARRLKNISHIRCLKANDKG